MALIIEIRAATAEGVGGTISSLHSGLANPELKSRLLSHCLRVLSCTVEGNEVILLVYNNI